MDPADRAASPPFFTWGRFAVTFWVSVLGGGALLAASAVDAVRTSPSSLGPAYVMIVALVVLGELRPVFTTVTSSNPVSISEAFVFAALFLWGLWPAVFLQALAVLISELLQRKAAWKVCFNVGQYVLSIASGWVVFAALAGINPPGSATHLLDGYALPRIVACWVVFHVVNLALVAGVARTMTWWESFTDDFWYYTFSTFAVIALSPLIAVVAVAAPASWALLPLLLLPLLAVHQTARVLREKEHASLHDPLTGLANRKLLANRLSTAREDASLAGQSVSLLLLDLDRFKDVNDTLGHLVGDRLLRIVARRVVAAVRPRDTVARLGGDEFAVLLAGVASQGASVLVAERIRAALLEPIRLDGVLLDVDVSIGVTVLGGGAPAGDASPAGAAFEELLRQADVAMYVAKGDRTGVEVYDPVRDAHSPALLGMATALREALDDGRLEVHFQPKVAVASGDVVGVEALARWTHPTRGPVPPDEFIPLADQSGLMDRLTASVLDASLAQARRWWEEGLRVPVAVNVTMRDLQHEEAAQRVLAALETHGLPPEMLVLEVTESVLVQEPALAVAALRTLAASGVLASIDDFGTGYSSLVRLQHLPVAELKVDRSFVSQLDTPASEALVRSIVAFAHGLGLLVVAEGVEVEAERQALRAMGCDVLQGWLVARAMDPGTATAWLRARLRPGAAPLSHAAVGGA